MLLRINDQLLHDHKSLRATPHALVLDSPTADVLARVWYGRMVLPPNDAYSPALPNYTFGKLRQSLVHSASHGEDVPLGIGCSSPTQQAVIAATSRRSLSEEGHDEAITCAQDELFCWFGCMSLPEYNISSVYSCAERNLSLECMNPRGQVHENGMEHGDFFPACTDRTHETHPVTPFPTIDQQDENACTSDLWTEFLMEDSYDHKATLTSRMVPRLSSYGPLSTVAMARRNSMLGLYSTMCLDGWPLASPIQMIPVSMECLEQTSY